MGTKANPGKWDCYAKAKEDEPVFVLLGRDPHAPTLVWLWAVLRELDGENPEKVAEARACVLQMIGYWSEKCDRKAAGLGQAVLAGVLELIRTANYGAKTADNEMTTLDMARRFLAQTSFEGSKAEAATTEPIG